MTDFHSDSVVNPDTLATTLRTHLCGALRDGDVGTRVRLGGWVHRSRNLGGLVFVDLRDRAGLVQVSFDPAHAEQDSMERAASLSNETVILVEGEVVARPPEMRNVEVPTGTVEVRARRLQVVGPAGILAIPVARGRNENLAAEELRLRHRYLDLRRPELQRNIVLRHRLMQRTRGFLSAQGFVEVETPILTKPTPEGARDYLVPSRVHAGEFYALPQSPQLYKQLLMIAGFDRYFQIARCFRDEDLRADRQPEFTQIDIEASFVDQEDVMRLTEGLLRELWAEAGLTVPDRFPRMSYREAMERFGIDRPDLRYGLEIADASAQFAKIDFAIGRRALDQGGRVRGIVIPGGGRLSRKQVDDIEAIAKSAGAGGLIRVKRAGDVVEGSPAAKMLGADGAAALGIGDGDLALYAAGPDHVTNPALDRVRQALARQLELVRPGDQRFLWVTDFPMFELDHASGSLAAMHHPFTSPAAADVGLLDGRAHEARARAYDVVLNGTELGGGSIRISDPALQSRIFTLLGIDDETARARFGFLLEGLRAGAPPHGGIALGFDRITMLLSDATSLRDVIAFPKTTAAQALFEGAPSPVPAQDLEQLHIMVREEVERA